MIKGELINGFMHKYELEELLLKSFGQSLFFSFTLIETLRFWKGKIVFYTV